MAESKPLLLFDAIETVFSLDPLAARMKDAGLPEHARELFFAQLLRDAFAIAAAGEFQPFAGVASGTLEVLLANFGKDASAEQRDQILDAFSELVPHDDVKPAFEQARERGATIILLTNGSDRITEKLVTDAGLEELVDGVVSISEFSVWKPDHRVYLRAAERYGHSAGEAGLIATHAWDVQGAAKAGLKTGWVERQDRLYHPAMAQPHVSGKTLPNVVDELLDVLAD